MSDFDKEAEREKLREQLEREEESREATQHMSELLLKGATMTNKHCDECGDPVFRYQGQEFCPTCGEEVAAGEGAQGAQPDQRGDDTPAQAAAADTEQPLGETGTQVSSPDQAADRQSTQQPGRGASAGGQPAQRSSAPTGSQAATAAGDLGEARAALVRKLTRLAQQAEATDDVGRSRDLLAAAREAAEALAAVDQVGR